MHSTDAALVFSLSLFEYACGDATKIPSLAKNLRMTREEREASKKK